MKGWLRKLRGMVGIGAVWGLVGTVLGSAAAVAVTLIGGTPLLQSLLTWGLPTGFVSFVLGTGFAGVLGLVEGRRTFAQLSAGRAAALGALVGGVFPVGWLVVSKAAGLSWVGGLTGSDILVALAGASGSYAVVTAGLAAGTVWAARRAPELPAGSEQADGRLLDEPPDG